MFNVVIVIQLLEKVVWFTHWRCGASVYCANDQLKKMLSRL